jgi:hypothetical protein
MEIDPGIHIVMHLVFFGKTGVTLVSFFPNKCAREDGGEEQTRKTPARSSQ